MPTRRSAALTNMAPKSKTAGIAKKASGGKKKLSGFMKFSQERRPTLKAEKPDLTFGEVRPPPLPPIMCER